MTLTDRATIMTRAHAFVASGLASMCLVIGGCGTQSGPAVTSLDGPAGSVSPQAWGQECTIAKSSEVVYPPVLDYVSNASNRWFLITDYTSAQNDPVGLGDAPLVRASVTTTDGEALPARDARFDQMQRAAIDWARTAGAKVTAVVDASLADTVIAPLFVLITPAQGEPFFAGNCASQNFEEPLRTAFGQDYAATLTKLAVGPVGVNTAPTTTDTHTDQILAPGDAPEALLAKLTHISLSVQLPQQWQSEGGQRSRYVLITRVPQGWNDAVSLSYPTSTTQPARIGAYLPPEGTVEFWILGNDGDFRQQVRKIGTASTAELIALAASKPSRDKGTVVVGITSDSSIADLVAALGDVEVNVERAS